MNARARIWLWMALLLAAPLHAAAPPSFERSLQEADRLRSSSPEKFASLLASLNARVGEASQEQRQRLRYLQAYELAAYRNDLDAGIAQAKALFQEVTDPNLKYRAGSFLVNSFALNRNFREGLLYLHRTLPMRAEVNDRALRHDASHAASLLYSQLGQHKLSLQYAEETLADNPSPRSRCVATIHRVEAQHELKMLPADDAPFLQGIAQCLSIGEKLAANVIRLALARKWATQGRTDDAIDLLDQHVDEIAALGYQRLVAEVHALLAELRLGKTELAAAARHAELAIAQARHLTSVLPLMTAYKTLYLIAERRSEPVKALNYHKRYAEAQKAHLSDVNARELAFEIVRHETQQKTQQIDLLARQNEVLQLQQRVDQQAAQNNRLLILLLLLLLASIVYWAFRVKRRHVALRRQAETDALTGVSNRHHFTATSEQVLARCAQAGAPAALILFDLDHFKAINDSYGHITGDWVLHRVTEACGTLCRRIDPLGRLGGEEFAIVLDGYDLADAARLAEDCRARIARIDTRDSGYVFAVTASFGVSATPASGYDLSRLLSHADQVLYRAKREGRNRVCVSDGEAAGVAPVQSVLTIDDPVDAPTAGVGA